MIDNTLAADNDVTTSVEVTGSGPVHLTFEKPSSATVEIQAKLPTDDDSKYRTIRTMVEDAEKCEAAGPVELRAKVTAGAPARILIRDYSGY